MEPKFESAKRRYGIPLPERLTYQAWSKGLVEESRKYGRPMVAISNIRMRSVGSPDSEGFHVSEGTMGSSAQLASNNVTCVTICCLAFRKRMETWAYAYPASSTSWKKSIAALQTAADPPNHGRMIFAMSGCT